MLIDLCLTIETNAVALAPKYVLETRRRIFRFVANGIRFNIHYKDLGHTNTEHWTVFATNPLGDREHDLGLPLYPLFKDLFFNSLLFNSGYERRVVHDTVLGLEKDNPFVTVRDGHLLSLYFILTGSIILSSRLCQSYMFKGGYNPVKTVYNTIRASLIPTIAKTKPSDRTAAQLWTPNTTSRVVCWSRRPKTHHETNKTVTAAIVDTRVLAFALKYCDGYHLVNWTPDTARTKYKACAEYLKTESHHQQPPLVTPEKLHVLFRTSKGLFVVSKRSITKGRTHAVVIRKKDCDDKVYVWRPPDELYRYDTISEYIINLDLNCEDDVDVSQVV